VVVNFQQSFPEHDCLSHQLTLHMTEIKESAKSLLYCTTQPIPLIVQVSLKNAHIHKSSSKMKTHTGRQNRLVNSSVDHDFIHTANISKQIFPVARDTHFVKASKKYQQIM